MLQIRTWFSIFIHHIISREFLIYFISKKIVLHVILRIITQNCFEIIAVLLETLNNFIPSSGISIFLKPTIINTKTFLHQLVFVFTSFWIRFESFSSIVF